MGAKKSRFFLWGKRRVSQAMGAALSTAGVTKVTSKIKLKQ